MATEDAAQQANARVGPLRKSSEAAAAGLADVAGAYTSAAFRAKGGTALNPG